MKKLIKLSSALLLILSLSFMFAATAAAAATPSIDYTGEWNSDGTVLTLTGKVNNPDNKFYSGAVALDYDPALFEVTDADVTAETDFSLIKSEVDQTNGHIRTDLAYLGSGGGLPASSTPTSATKVKLKLKNGKTKNDVPVNTDGTSNSVKISTDKNYINSLGTSYSGGAVNIYGSKEKDGGTVTRFDTDSSNASGSVKLPANSTPQQKTITSINPVSVSTVAGTKPSLPATVTVKYSDGTTASLPVTWDAIQASQYASEGTFKVNGTVAGTDIKAEATVTVTKSTGGGGGGGGSSNPTSRTGENVVMYTVMSILLAASIIVIVIVLVSRKKNKGGE